MSDTVLGLSLVGGLVLLVVVVAARNWWRTGRRGDSRHEVSVDAVRRRVAEQELESGVPQAMRGPSVF